MIIRKTFHPTLFLHWSKLSFVNVNKCKRALSAVTDLNFQGRSSRWQHSCKSCCNTEIKLEQFAGQWTVSITFKSGEKCSWNETWKCDLLMMWCKLTGCSLPRFTIKPPLLFLKCYELITKNKISSHFRITSENCKYLLLWYFIHYKEKKTVQYFNVKSK